MPDASVSEMDNVKRPGVRSRVAVESELKNVEADYAIQSRRTHRIQIEGLARGAKIGGKRSAHATRTNLPSNRVAGDEFANHSPDASISLADVMPRSEECQRFAGNTSESV